MKREIRLMRGDRGLLAANRRRARVNILRAVRSASGFRPCRLVAAGH
jgi:hypothetical protein